MILFVMWVAGGITGFGIAMAVLPKKRGMANV